MSLQRHQRIIRGWLPVLFPPLLAGCGEGLADRPPRAPAVFADTPGDPVPGLTPEEAERFRHGHTLFRKIFTEEEGLGPLFNGDSCNACHTNPADGGTGDQFLVRATALEEDGSCDALEGEGENIRQLATPRLQAHGIFAEEIPENATAVSDINVPFLFGLGLIEAIPEEEILSRVGRAGAHGELSGRAGRDAKGALARFGRKANVATLFEFVEEALRLEMGITNPMNPDDRGPNRRPLPDGADPTPGAEVEMEALERLTDFVQLLAPLPRRLPDDHDAQELVRRGEENFREIGCAGCHVPYMETGPAPFPALDRKRIYLYSDLLLHDMGPQMSGVCSSSAESTEYRTEMLMGLSHRREYLHDSRAGSLWEAIRHHGGEASGARGRFDLLDRLEQEAVIRFLGTL